MNCPSLGLPGATAWATSAVADAMTARVMPGFRPLRKNRSMGNTTTHGAATERRLGITWALVGALGGACFVIPWKLAGEFGQPAHSALILLVSAAIASTMLAVGQLFTSKRRRLRITAVELGVAGLLATVTLFGNLASARAIALLSPALLNVVLRTEVIIVAILAWLFLSERDFVIPG